MFLALLFIFFLPFIASEDFEEINHRKFQAVDLAREQIERVLKIAEEKTNTTDRTMFVQCSKTEYLESFEVLSHYIDLENFRITNAKVVNGYNRYLKFNEMHHTVLLHAEVQSNNMNVSLDFWQFGSVYYGRWELYRVENLNCVGLPKKSYLQEAIEMVQYLHAFRDVEGWKKNTLHMMFVGPSWFKFCDGSVDRYFIHRSDSLKNGRLPLIIHDLVAFKRDTERSKDLGLYWQTKTMPVAYIQMDVTLNGRRMLLEYDDDWKMFTKGKEYPCPGENAVIWK